MQKDVVKVEILVFAEPSRPLPAMFVNSVISVHMLWTDAETELFELSVYYSSLNYLSSQSSISLSL